MVKTIPVLEIFGPTIQGEGAVIGTKTMFVRTAGCDYQCKWCDSAFTWDGSAKDEIKQLSAEEIWSQLTEIGGTNFSHVTISGGNPALLANMESLISLLRENGIRIGVETQGSKWQDWLQRVQDVTISPKPPSSGMVTDYEKLSEIIGNLHGIKENQLSLKVVVFNDEDFAYAKQIHQRYPNVPFYLQVGNDNVFGDDQSQIVSSLLTKYEWLIDEVVKTNEMNNVKVLPQLHTLVWGNKRGV
ncbi:7-carboxy-7-deazaguanine synthase [Bacillus mesophilus]|uniref:7-carboxy-7-deazaguanine synthase n=1 Tax=Bacillus mesophilus TaxID=1808955 RepID=A0A6M0Q2H7_9BACI|nr:7-carboxy-7-deazaguanine synthase [Bacillus mesophilus]NEY70497.1 7-carboxy-7-deazaguanine synthase QueE [Bacillus mesophilus]